MSAGPSAMKSAFHRLRSCSAIGISPPSGPVRAGFVGEQHERKQPRHLAVIGQQAVDHAGQPERFGRQFTALQPPTARKVSAVCDTGDSEE